MDRLSPIKPTSDEAKKVNDEDAGSKSSQVNAASSQATAQAASHDQFEMAESFTTPGDIASAIKEAEKRKQEQKRFKAKAKKGKRCGSREWKQTIGKKRQDGYDDFSL
jgi:hypothetical protein